MTLLFAAIGFFAVFLIGAVVLIVAAPQMEDHP